jgi:hypothetical protein
MAIQPTPQAITQRDHSQPPPITVFLPTIFALLCSVAAACAEYRSATYVRV